MKRKKIGKRIIVSVVFFVCVAAGNFLCAAAPETNEGTISVVPNILDGVAWYNAQNWPVENKGWPNTERYFARLPLRAQPMVTESVWNLSQDSTGLAMRFRTNAKTIRVKYRLFSERLAMPHMPATGVSGLDLYALDEGRWKWVACTRPENVEADVSLIAGLDGTMRDYQLYLPLYNGVDALEIGVPSSSEFFAGEPHTDVKPILYYGTSITQGGCCSRPGNTFTAILSRRLNWPILNLGFSGSARMEPLLAELFAELDPVLIVLDASPNMNPDLIDERAVGFVQTLRDHNPETPILLVEGQNCSNTWILPEKAEFHRRNHDAVKRVYDHFLAQNDTNIYYLSADSMLGEPSDYDATMDGSHLNDLGMFRMADALERAIRPIFSHYGPGQ